MLPWGRLVCSDGRVMHIKARHAIFEFMKWENMRNMTIIHIDLRVQDSWGHCEMCECFFFPPHLFSSHRHRWSEYRGGPSTVPWGALILRVKVKVVACPHSLRSACQQVQDPITCCRPVLSPRSLSFIMSLEGTIIIILKKTFSKTAAMKQKNLSMSNVRKGWMQVESSRDGMHKHNAGNNASWKSEGVQPVIRDGDWLWLEYKTLFLKWCSQGESLLFSD